MFQIKQTITSPIVTKNPKPNNVLVNVVVIVTTCSQVPKQHVFKECELVKEKAVIDQQTEEQLRDSFIHTIRELQGSDLTSQTFVNLNGPLHSNWVGLSKFVNQLAISKQPTQLTPQIISLEKILEEILKDINIQVLETKYVINLGQLLKIVLDIK